MVMYKRGAWAQTPNSVNDAMMAANLQCKTLWVFGCGWWGKKIYVFWKLPHSDPNLNTISKCLLKCCVLAGSGLVSTPGIPASYPIICMLVLSMCVRIKVAGRLGRTKIVQFRRQAIRATTQPTVRNTVCTLVIFSCISPQGRHKASAARLRRQHSEASCSVSQLLHFRRQFSARAQNPTM